MKKTNASLVPGTPSLWMVCAALSLGGCDCEDRVRRALSDPGARGQSGRSSGDGVDQGAAVLPSSTEPEEIEPNDGRGMATRHELGKELRALRASIGRKGDEDWFLVGAPGDELVEVSVEPLEEELDLSVALMGSDDTPSRYEVAGAGKPEVIPWVRIKGGQAIAMKVASKRGQGAYHVRFRRHLSAGTLEAEPNESWSDAIRLGAGVELQGFYDRPGDLDRYVLGSAGEQEVRHLEVSGVERLEQRIALVRDEVVYWSRELPVGQGIVLPNLGAGEWGIELGAKGESYSRESPYRLRVVNVAAPEKVEGKRVVLEQEPNDPMDSGASDKPVWEVGQTPIVVRGSVLDAKDVDVLRLSTLADVLRVRLRSTDVTRQVWMRVGESEEQAWVTSAEGVERCVRMDTSQPAPRESVVVVGGRAERALSYELEVWEVSGGGGALGDEVEPNEEMAQATAYAGAGIPWRGYILTQGDRDWYVFEVEEAERTVTLELEAHELDLSLSLRDAEGGVVAEARGAGAGGSERIELRLPQGKYMVRVSAEQGSSCEAYVLSMTSR